MTRAIDEVPPSAFDVRLDEETTQLAGRIRSHNWEKQ